MALPGLLIEYLINGSIALIWILPFMPQELKGFKDFSSVLLIPVAYILGMYVDIIAFILTSYPKTMLRKFIQKRYKSNAGKDVPGVGKRAEVEIMNTHPDLAKELGTRSSRDRIARGMIINSLFLLIFFCPMPKWIGLILFLLSILMWIAFEYSSYGFFLSSYESAKEKKL